MMFQGQVSQLTTIHVNSVTFIRYYSYSLYLFSYEFISDIIILFREQEQEQETGTVLLHVITRL